LAHTYIKLLCTTVPLQVTSSYTYAHMQTHRFEGHFPGKGGLASSLPADKNRPKVYFNPLSRVLIFKINNGNM